MNIKLKSLTLENFKGIKDLHLEFFDNTTISGENASGKTTVFDAFTWVLFGKDSNNITQFDLKTLDENGDVIPKLDHSVRAVLDVDGVETTLKRTYREKWVKKHGTIDKIQEGHETLYEVNGQSVKKNVYEEAVNDIIYENEFKILTNPFYFSQHLDKDKRRETLLNLASVNPETVFDKMEIPHEELRTIYENLSSKGKDFSVMTITERFKTSLSATKRNLQSLPDRINDLKGTLSGINEEEISNKKAKLLQKEKSLKESLTIEKDKDVRKEIQEKINKLNAEKNLIQKRAEDAFDKTFSEYHERKSAFLTKESEFKQNLFKRQQEIKNLSDKKEELLKRRETLLGEYKSLKDLSFSGGDICPTCNQSLPRETLEETKRSFERDKLAKLDENIKKGKKIKASLEDLEEKLKNLKAIKEEAPVFNEVPPTKEKADTKKLDEKINNHYKELESFGSNNSLSSIEESLSEVRKDLRDLSIKEALLEKDKATSLKIKELSEEEKRLRAQYHNDEKVLHQLKSFDVTRVNLISETVNEAFDMVKFRLFDTLVNGNTVEVCEALIDGVPFNSANSAAKTNAGLDIIKGLSKIYKKKAPIFIDNAEGINNILDTGAQQITLRVSNDKTLKIEEEGVLEEKTLDPYEEHYDDTEEIIKISKTLPKKETLKEEPSEKEKILASLEKGLAGLGVSQEETKEDAFDPYSSYDEDDEVLSQLKDDTEEKIFLKELREKEGSEEVFSLEDLGIHVETSEDKAASPRNLDTEIKNVKDEIDEKMATEDFPLSFSDDPY